MNIQPSLINLSAQEMTSPFQRHLTASQLPYLGIGPAMGPALTSVPEPTFLLQSLAQQPASQTASPASGNIVISNGINFGEGDSNVITIHLI